MPNFATEYTPRIKIEYVVDQVPHTALIRFQRDIIIDESMKAALCEAWRAMFEDVLEMTALQSGTSQAKADIVGAAFADQDSTVFLPFTPTVLPIAAGDDTGGTATPLSRASLYSITGLSTMGKRVTLYLWGIRALLGSGGNYSDWRLSAAELTDIPTVWGDHLTTSTVGSLAELMGCADGEPVAFFRQRLNARVSASAVNSARG